MDKSGKVYVKAMNKYNDGYIDKSLALCEKSISLNNANAAALNLKGILYYLKGDLEKAKKAWNINCKINSDNVSKKYLIDSVRDKEKLHLYIKALELIKKLNINAALLILEQCENSHFNFINVNNNISSCYIKQGEYDKALQHINEVLKVDKKNTEAIANKKTLVEYGGLKRDINYKKIATATIILIAIMLLIAKGYMYNHENFSKNAVKKIQSGTALIGKTNKEETKNLTEIQNQKSQNKKTENKIQQIPKFPQEQFKESVKNNNMEQIVLYINKWKSINLNTNDRLLLTQGEKIVKQNGVLFFYTKGTSYLDKKNFVEAQKYFSYALQYSDGNYLKEHIIYMLSVSYKSVSDFENAIKYYELSLKQFPKGTYTEEILYNLIIINKEIDINKAKSYAEKLIKQFPNSQYDNTIVKKILGL